MSTDSQFKVAVNAEPGTRDTFSLRSIQHKDREGKLISTFHETRELLTEYVMRANSLSADPDLSNPTRNRLERPLDTIRGFEAAIESHRKQNRM
jgi:hypothetical protein